MIHFTIVRDFNRIKKYCGDVGFIRIYMIDDLLAVTVTQIHDDGQAVIHVNYSRELPLYDVFISILDKITNDYICFF